MIKFESLRKKLLANPEVRKEYEFSKPLAPNFKTIKALKTSLKGDIVTVGSIDDLLTELEAED